jgi:hypothetical protein
MCLHMCLCFCIFQLYSVRPEGGLAIPSRNLFLASSEDDERPLNVRSSISIYYKNFDHPVYPFISSSDRYNKPGIPIPFGGLSSLTTGKCRTQVRVSDGAYLFRIYGSLWFFSSLMLFGMILICCCYCLSYVHRAHLVETVMKESSCTRPIMTFTRGI